MGEKQRKLIFAIDEKISDVDDTLTILRRFIESLIYGPHTVTATDLDCGVRLVREVETMMRGISGSLDKLREANGMPVWLVEEEAV